MKVDEQILASLRLWKKRQFVDKQVQLSQITRQIREGSESFKMVAINPRKWMCMSKDTGLPVVFVFPVCWNSNYDLQAGNFLPDNVEDKGKHRIVREISPFLSKIAYYFDVSLDDSFLKYMKVLEDLVQSNENFNIARKKRKEWQNGAVSGGRYQVEHKLFVHAGKNYVEIPDKDLTGVHPWLVDAIRNQPPPKRFNLNVPFPAHVDYTEAGSTSILDEDPPTFSKGDIVVMTFRLGYIIGENEWWPEILPDEFIRVEKANSDNSELYLKANWPERDPTVQRLSVHRKKKEPGYDTHITQSTQSTATLANGEQDPMNTSADMDQDPPHPQGEDSDDDSLSEHSAASIKRRIRRLVFDDEDMVPVEDESTPDPEDDLEPAGERSKLRPRKKARK